MIQIFVVFVGGLFVICGEMVMMVLVDYQYIVVIIVIFDFFGSIGIVFGFIVLVVIWIGIFKKVIECYVLDIVNVEFVYNNLYFQLGFLLGSEE